MVHPMDDLRAEARLHLAWLRRAGGRWLPADGPPPSGDTAGEALGRLAAEIAACTRCELCRTRTRTVPGEGGVRPPGVRRR